jgi:hydroxymethylpyrimidine pyrophosphatase-like HAD family hydrolase
VTQEERDRLTSLIGRERLARVRRLGAVVLDVDDTLLARPALPGQDRAEAPGREVQPLIRGLLGKGVRVILVTGHGWEQLKRRWIEPSLLQSVATAGRLQIYANRGATKVVCDNTTFSEDRAYRDVHAIASEHQTPLLQLLTSLREAYVRDLQTRASWYRRTYSRFDFDQTPVVSLREEVVAQLRPLPSRVHASGVAPDPRSDLSERGRAELDEQGLSGVYELGESGRSTIEIVRRGISKRVALEDAIRVLSATTGASQQATERSLVYVGDEFHPGGNDRVVAVSFPQCLCFSVAPATAGGAGTRGVIDLSEQTGASGPAAAQHFLSFLLDSLSEELAPQV